MSIMPFSLFEKIPGCYFGTGMLRSSMDCLDIPATKKYFFPPFSNLIKNGFRGPLFTNSSPSPLVSFQSFYVISIPP